MIDRLVFLERKSGLSIEAFQRHWREIHGPIAADIPGVRHYSQCSFDPDERPVERRLGSLSVDGIAVLSFDDLPAIRAAFTPAVVSALVEDEKLFVGGLDLLTTVPRSLGPDVAAASHRLISLLQRRDDVDASTFHDRWWMGDEDLAASLPRGASWVRHLVVDHGLGAVPWGAPVVHGVEEFACAEPSVMEALCTGTFSRVLGERRAALANEAASWKVLAHSVV